ncbi:MAG: hypothetical protein HP496_15185 [Nitrospira sp.]|nr:hypothetical protein [Nitrospira sp.]
MDTSHAIFYPVLPRLKRLATMHGSVAVGDGGKALHNPAGVFRDLLEPPERHGVTDRVRLLC